MKKSKAIFLKNYATLVRGNLAKKKMVIEEQMNKYFEIDTQSVDNENKLDNEL